MKFKIEKRNEVYWIFSKKNIFSCWQNQGNAPTYVEARDHIERLITSECDIWQPAKSIAKIEISASIKNMARA